MSDRDAEQAKGVGGQATTAYPSTRQSWQGAKNGQTGRPGRHTKQQVASGEWRVGSVHLHLPANPSAGLITVSKRTGAGPAASPSVVINLAKLLFSLGFSPRGTGRGRGGRLRSAISISISTLRYPTTKGAATSTTDPFRRLGL